MREQPTIKIAWAPPSMSCRGPLVAGVKATSPADRATQWAPTARHRRLRRVTSPYGPLALSQPRPPFRKCVRDFYSLSERPATQSRKENPAILLSTGLSTKVPHSCTEMIKFSTVQDDRLWTLDGASSADRRPDGGALGCCRATATRHEGLDLDTDPAVRSVRALGG